MIRKVYEVDPMVCPKCGGRMKVVAFIPNYPAVDQIIDHLRLTFVAEKPPPSRVLTEVALTRPPREGLRNAALMAAEESGSPASFGPRRRMFRAHPSFVRPFSRISQELTRPTDRKYIAGVLKWGNSAAGVGIRGVPGKANSYLSIPFFIFRTLFSLPGRSAPADLG